MFNDTINVSNSLTISYFEGTCEYNVSCRLLIGEILVEIM